MTKPTQPPVLFRSDGTVVGQVASSPIAALDGAVTDYQAQGLTELTTYWLVSSDHYMRGAHNNPGVSQIPVQSNPDEDTLTTHGINTIVVAQLGTDPSNYDHVKKKHGVPPSVWKAFVTRL